MCPSSSCSGRRPRSWPRTRTTSTRWKRTRRVLASGDASRRREIGALTPVLALRRPGLRQPFRLRERAARAGQRDLVVDEIDREIVAVVLQVFFLDHVLE